MTRDRPAGLVVGVMLMAAVLVAGMSSSPAEAACILSATHLGQAYVDGGALPAGETGGRAGRATLPACDDTPGAGPVETPSTVTVTRVRGVAPRFAVALPSGPSSELLMAEGIPCERATTAAILACLRERTRRLVEDPSLIAPPSARAGEIIGLGVHIRNPALRRTAVYGVQSLLQRRIGARWRSTHHLLHPNPDDAAPPAPFAVGTPNVGWESIGLTGEAPRPARLPRVEPGAYRIVKELQLGGGRRTRLVAHLTIRAAAKP